MYGVKGRWIAFVKNGRSSLASFRHQSSEAWGSLYLSPCQFLKASEFLLEYMRLSSLQNNHLVCQDIEFILAVELTRST